MQTKFSVIQLCLRNVARIFSLVSETSRIFCLFPSFRFTNYASTCTECFQKKQNMNNTVWWYFRIFRSTAKKIICNSSLRKCKKQFSVSSSDACLEFIFYTKNQFERLKATKDFFHSFSLLSLSTGRFHWSVFLVFSQFHLRDRLIFGEDSLACTHGKNKNKQKLNRKKRRKKNRAHCKQIHRHSLT